MNAPTIKSGSPVEILLKSLGFINITGVKIMDGPRVYREVGFPTPRFRNLWDCVRYYTIIVNSEGDVFLRYGSNDITQGDVFREIITELGCQKDNEGMIISASTPGSGQQFDSEQLLERIFSQKILI